MDIDNVQKPNMPYHVPVMLMEAIDYLNIRPCGTYADLTLGGGGHSAEIIKRLAGGRLIAFDRDSDAIENANKTLIKSGCDVRIVHENFSAIEKVLDSLGIAEIDGALMDLGVSSHQLDDADRGFSYMKEAPLDMRMSRDDSLDARAIVNTYDGDEIKRIIQTFGEEKYAGPITRAILRAREKAPIETTDSLVRIIEDALKKVRYDGGHPAKRTFQALRIAVNGELNVIEPAINAVVRRLKPGGRIVVITFHSLEDRIVKKVFAHHAKECICPPGLPACVCGKVQSLRILTKKPVYPSDAEAAVNPRAKSAKLRVAERV